MPKQFVLTIALRMQGPGRSEIKPVIDNLRKELGSIKGTIDLKLPANLSKNLSAILPKLKSFKTLLGGMSALTANAFAFPAGLSKNITSISSSVRKLNSSLAALDVTKLQQLKSALRGSQTIGINLPKGLGRNLSAINGGLAALGHNLRFISENVAGLERAGAVLSGLNGINLRVDKNAARNLSLVNRQLERLNSNLATTAGNATRAEAAIRGLVTSFNGAQAGALKVANNTQKVQQQSVTASKAVNNFSSEIEKFGFQAGLAARRFAAFSIPVAIIYSFIDAARGGIAAAIDFDTALTKIVQVSGESRENLSGLTKEITNLSTSLGVSSADLTNAAETLLQAGLNAGDTEKSLRILAKTALSPSFGDMEQTTEGVIAVLGQFGGGVDDLERKFGALNAVSKAYAVESQDLVTAIQKTGGAFQASGGSFEELLALFTSVRSKTRESADSIATAFRTIFARLQRPDTIRELEDAFDIKLSDNGLFVGPLEAVRRLAEQIEKLPEGSLVAANIAEIVGGIRQISKTIPLTQQFATTQQALKVALAGGNSLTTDAATAQQALAIQARRVSEEFLALFRAIADSSSFQTLVQGALSLASALIKVADAGRPLLPILTAIATVKAIKTGTQLVKGFGRGFIQSGLLDVSAFTGDLLVKTKQTAGSRIGAALGGAVGGNTAQSVAIGALTKVMVPLTPAIVLLTTAVSANTAALAASSGVGRVIGSVASGAFGRSPLRRSLGGRVPGFGDGDKVPALLEPGEFVLRKKVAQSIGFNRLRGLNKMKTGGIAGFNPRMTVSGVGDASKVIQKLVQSLGISAEAFKSLGVTVKKITDSEFKQLKDSLGGVSPGASFNPSTGQIGIIPDKTNVSALVHELGHAIDSAVGKKIGAPFASGVEGTGLNELTKKNAKRQAEFAQNLANQVGLSGANRDQFIKNRTSAPENFATGFQHNPQFRRDALVEAGLVSSRAPTTRTPASSRQVSRRDRDRLVAEELARRSSLPPSKGGSPSTNKQFRISNTGGVTNRGGLQSLIASKVNQQRLRRASGQLNILNGFETNNPLPNELSQATQRKFAGSFGRSPFAKQPGRFSRAASAARGFASSPFKIGVAGAIGTAIATPFARRVGEAGPGTELEKRVRGERFAGIAGGTLSGATGGAAIGATLGPVGAAIGGVAGAAIGLTTGLLNAEKNVRELKIDDAFKKVALSATAFEKALAGGDSDKILKAFNDSLKASTVASNQAAAANEFGRLESASEKLGIVFGLATDGFFEAVSNGVSDFTKSLGGVRSGLDGLIESLTGVSNGGKFASDAFLNFAAGLGVPVKGVEILSGIVEGTQAVNQKKRQNVSDRQIVGQQVGSAVGTIQTLSKQKGLRSVDQLVGSEDGLNALRVLFQKQQLDSSNVATRADADAGFDRAFANRNKNPELFKKFIEGLLAEAPQINLRLDEINNAIADFAVKLDGQVGAVEHTLTALGDFRIASQQSDNVSNALLGVTGRGPSSIQSSALADTLAQFGSGNFAGATNRVAQASPSAAPLASTLQDFNKAFSALGTILPDVLSQDSLANRGNLADVLKEQLTTAGIGDEVRDSIVNQFSVITSGDAVVFTKLRADTNKFREEILAGGDQAREAFARLGSQIDEQGNKIFESLGRISELNNEISSSFNKRNQLLLASAENRAADRVRTQGGDITDFISVDQFNKPFQRQQEILSGLTGGAAIDPTALGKKAQQLQGLIPGAATQAAGGDFGDVQKFRELENETQNVIESLRNLTDVSNLNAAAQRRLTLLENDRQSRLKTAEGLLAGGPKARREFGQGAVSSLRAIQGGLDNLSETDRTRAIGFLRQNQDTRLFGGNETGGQILERLIENSQIGKLLGPNAAAQDEAGKLREEIQRGFTIAVEAQNQLTQILQTQETQFFQDLDANQKAFLAALGGALVPIINVPQGGGQLPAGGGVAGIPARAAQAAQANGGAGQILNIDALSGVVVNFGGVVGNLSETVQKLTTTLDSLAGLQITLEAHHVVEVILNGAQILERLVPELQDLILATTKSELRKIIPDAGVNIHL